MINWEMFLLLTRNEQVGVAFFFLGVVVFPLLMALIPVMIGDIERKKRIGSWGMSKDELYRPRGSGAKPWIKSGREGGPGAGRAATRK
jgi:hypothetical protein